MPKQSPTRSTRIIGSGLIEIRLISMQKVPGATETVQVINRSIALIRCSVGKCCSRLIPYTVAVSSAVYPPTQDD